MLSAERDLQLRRVIKRKLQELEDELAQFEQTTHAYMTNGDVAKVGESLAEAYISPSSFTISNLAQSIYHFLRKEGK
jgi:hypothetical protein